MTASSPFPAAAVWHPGWAVFGPATKLTRPVLLAWVPGFLLIDRAGLSGTPIGVQEELPRPKAPNVREGAVYDSWRVDGHRYGVHRMFGAVARQVER